MMSTTSTLIILLLICVTKFIEAQILNNNNQQQQRREQIVFSDSQIYQATNNNNSPAPPPPPRDEFGRPVPPPRDQFGRPVPPPIDEFGRPVPPPRDQFGRPVPPPRDQFGRPVPPPRDQFGRPVPPPRDQFGRPVPPPRDQFGRPVPPPRDEFERPPPEDEFGRPVPPPTDEFGRPQPPPTDQFGRPMPPPMDEYGNPIPPPDDPRPPYISNEWYAPRSPAPQHYRDFSVVFHDIGQKTEAHEYNQTAETEAIHDDFNGRSIVSPGQYPHMAALGFRNSDTREIEYKCGGSLISENFVLTAAHCLRTHGSAPDVVKIGDIRLKEWEEDVMPQRRRVAQIHLYPLYNETYYYHDIGLIQLHRPVQFTWFVRPIRLWVRNEIPYSKLHTMGYGSTGFGEAQTNILTELELSVVPTMQCNQTLPADDSAPIGILNSQICAHDFEKNRDTCQGDSGGPLQLNLQRRRRHKRLRYYLVGITSYGTYCRSPFPGVYTRVSSYIDWITSIVWPNHFERFRNKRSSSH